MSVLAIIPSVLSLIGNGIKGFLGIKQNQLETFVKGIDLIKQVDMNDAAQRNAAMATIVADANSESWLARSWRPITMLVFVGLLVARYFGYVPSNMSPEDITWMNNMIEFGILGYGGSRTLEKVVSSVNLSVLLNKVLGGK